MLWRRENGIEHAVDAIANDQSTFKRFEMDVTRSLPDRLEQYRVHQPNDRRFVRRIKQVLGFVQLMGDFVEIFAGCNVLHHLFRTGGTRSLVVRAIETGHQGHGASEYRLHGHPQEKA